MLSNPFWWLISVIDSDYVATKKFLTFTDYRKFEMKYTLFRHLLPSIIVLHSTHKRIQYV